MGNGLAVRKKFRNCLIEQSKRKGRERKREEIHLGLEFSRACLITIIIEILKTSYIGDKKRKQLEKVYAKLSN